MAEESPKGETNKDEQNPAFENFQRLLKQVLSAPSEKLDEKRPTTGGRSNVSH